MNRISKCWSKSQVHLSTLQSKGSVGRGVFCGGVGVGHGIHTDGRQGPTPYQPLSTPPPPPVAIVTLFISSTLSAFPANLYQLMKHFPFPSGFSSELISISFISSPLTDSGGMDGCRWNRELCVARMNHFCCGLCLRTLNNRLYLQTTAST